MTSLPIDVKVLVERLDAILAVLEDWDIGAHRLPVDSEIRSSVDRALQMTSKLNSDVKESLERQRPLDFGKITRSSRT